MITKQATVYAVGSLVALSTTSSTNSVAPRTARSNRAAEPFRS
jgi:hypothetical protein